MEGCSGVAGQGQIQLRHHLRKRRRRKVSKEFQGKIRSDHGNIQQGLFSTLYAQLVFLMKKVLLPYLYASIIVGFAFQAQHLSSQFQQSVHQFLKILNKQQLNHLLSLNQYGHYSQYNSHPSPSKYSLPQGLRYQTCEVELRCIGEALALTQELQRTELASHTLEAISIEDEVARLADLAQSRLGRTPYVQHAVADSSRNATSIIRVISGGAFQALCCIGAQYTIGDIAVLTGITGLIYEESVLAFLTGCAIETCGTVISTLYRAGFGLWVEIVSWQAQFTDSRTGTEIAVIRTQPRAGRTEPLCTVPRWNGVISIGAARAIGGGVTSHAEVDELVAKEAPPELLTENGGEGVGGALVGELHAGLAVVVLAGADAEGSAGQTEEVLQVKPRDALLTGACIGDGDAVVRPNGFGLSPGGKHKAEEEGDRQQNGNLGTHIIIRQIIHHQTTFLFLFILSFFFPSSFLSFFPPGLFMGIELTIFSFWRMKSFGFSNYQSMNMVHRTKQGTELWLGDYYAASNVSLLKQKNIRAVLTSAAMLGISYPKEHAISHKIINAFDVPSYKMTPHFEEAYRFIDESLRQGHILVHCAAGISRSTTFVLVFLMRGEGMGLKHAMDYVRGKRSVICPNYGFQNELKRLQMQLKKGGKQDNSLLDNKNVSSFTQKKAVLDFLNEDKGKKEEKLSFTTTAGGSKFTPPNFAATVGGSGSNGMSVLNGSSFLRGKSVNYTQKRAQYHPPERGSSNAKQYLSFKLESPKIVTIKK